MFPTVIAAALDILDNGKVTKFVCQQSRRCFYRVREPSKGQAQRNREGLTTQAWHHDAECADANVDVVGEMSFTYFYARECVPETGGALFCKYVLAAKLAEALGSVSVKEIEDRDFQPMLLGSKQYAHKFEERKTS